MKKTTIISVLCLILFTANAQEHNSIRTIGWSGSASIIDFSFKGYLEPYLAWGSLKKQIVFSPTLLVASNLGYQSSQKVRLTGGRVGYRYWPSINHDKWGLYLAADLRMQRVKDYWNANTYNENSLEYQEYLVKTTEGSLENYLGYGLKYTIGKSVSIVQGVGIGWYMSHFKTKSNHAAGTDIDFLDYRGYDDFGFIWNIQLGVNYSF